MEFEIVHETDRAGCVHYVILRDGVRETSFFSNLEATTYVAARADGCTRKQARQAAGADFAEYAA